MVSQSSEVLEFVKKDIDEFTKVVSEEASSMVSSTATSLKEKLRVSSVLYLYILIRDSKTNHSYVSISVCLSVHQWKYLYNSTNVLIFSFTNELLLKGCHHSTQIFTL